MNTKIIESTTKTTPIEIVGGGFGIIAGVNGPFKEYKKHLFSDLIQLFTDTGKPVHMINFNVADELAMDEKEAYGIFNIKPRIHHHCNRQKKNIAELTEKRKDGINIIGLEVGLDHILHHIEKGDIHLGDIKKESDYWIRHGGDSVLRKYDVEIILGDATNSREFKKLTYATEQYMDVHNSFGYASNYIIVPIHDKAIGSDDYKIVKRKIFKAFNPHFVQKKAA